MSDPSVSLRLTAPFTQGSPPHPSRLAACHLPRRGRRPPGGGAFIGGPDLTFRCPLHTRRCGGTLSKQERAGGSPHLALPPSPRRGYESPAGGRLPPRGRWTGRSPGRMRGLPRRRKPPLRKGRWHGAAVTEGSIRLDVLTKPGSTGTLVRSLSQPAADSSLYAREPPSSVTPCGVPPSP